MTQPLPERAPTPTPCGVCKGPRVRMVSRGGILACTPCDRVDKWPARTVSGG
jgi:hypothetical protein